MGEVTRTILIELVIKFLGILRKPQSYFVYKRRNVLNVMFILLLISSVYLRAEKLVVYLRTEKGTIDGDPTTSFVYLDGNDRCIL